MDHFNYRPQSYATFKQRYIVSSKYWGSAQSNSPIFAWLGAESPINFDPRSVGFLTDNAPVLRLLLSTHSSFNYYLNVDKKSLKTRDIISEKSDATRIKVDGDLAPSQTKIGELDWAPLQYLELTMYLCLKVGSFEEFCAAAGKGRLRLSRTARGVEEGAAIELQRDIFVEHDVVRILRTPTSPQYEDSWFWKGDLKGAYTVKHGYHLLTRHHLAQDRFCSGIYRMEKIMGPPSAA
nr:lysosomal Pro-X carboxypeptidase-like [Ipomoea batatas]